MIRLGNQWLNPDFQPLPHDLHLLRTLHHSLSHSHHCPLQPVFALSPDFLDTEMAPLKRKASFDALDTSPKKKAKIASVHTLTSIGLVQRRRLPSICPKSQQRFLFSVSAPEVTLATLQLYSLLSRSNADFFASQLLRHRHQCLSPRHLSRRCLRQVPM